MIYVPFSQNIVHMQNLCSNAQNQVTYSNSFFPAQKLLPELVLLYPGRIPNKGDYRLEFHGAALSHTDVVRAVHEFTLSEDRNGQIITNFLVDLYQNGLDANSNTNSSITVTNQSLTLEQFKHLVYWLVLQEDINYPRPKHMGIRMPIIRYIEGAVAALHPNLLTLQQVLNRTNNHGGPPPQAFNNPELHQYLIHNLNQIR